MRDGKRMDRGRSRAGKRRVRIITGVIGTIAAVITIVLFLQGLLFPSDDRKQGGQSASVQTGDNSPVGVIQTENGDVNVDLTAASASSDAALSQDLSALSVPDRLARSYDLVCKARETGEYGEATAAIQEMTRLEGTDLQSMSILQYNLGLALYGSGELGAAQNAFRSAVRGGGFPDSFYSLGVVTAKIEEQKTTPDYQEAINAITCAIKGEKAPEYYRARAWVYEKAGFPEAAEADRAEAGRVEADRANAEIL